MDSGPPHAPEPDAALDRALDLVRFLRANCEWDAQQTPQSLVKHLLEETHEVVDAIQDEDVALLRSELGDLLLNLAFQVVIGEERGAFDAESVVAGLEAKMRRRHPHLYGDGERQDWERLKAQERASHDSALEGIPRGLDAVHKAHRLQERAAAVGFDWPSVDGALAKLDEELAEVREALRAARKSDADAADEGGAVAAELGDLMFSVVNVARLAGVHSATALDRTNREFVRRFQLMEAMASKADTKLHELELEAMEALWQRAKTTPSQDAT